MRTLLSVKWGVKVTCYAGDFICANALSERVVKVSTEQRALPSDSNWYGPSLIFTL